MAIHSIRRGIRGALVGWMLYTYLQEGVYMGYASITWTQPNVVKDAEYDARPPAIPIYYTGKRRCRDQ